MNKYASDSALLPHGSAAAWGHALARMQVEEDEKSRTSLADVLTRAMPANALHEILAASANDAASASGFALMLAAMLDKEGRALFLVREYRRGSGRYYPPGLAGLGIDPARCFSVDAPDTLSALKATADIARSGAAGAVVLELVGNPRLLGWRHGAPGFARGVGVEILMYLNCEIVRWVYDAGKRGISRLVPGVRARVCNAGHEHQLIRANTADRGYAALAMSSQRLAAMSAGSFIKP